MAKTLFEKIWDKHLVASIDKSTNLFTATKISLPKNNVSNEFIKGECVLN